MESITNAQLIEMMGTIQDLQLVDVRTPQEYALLGHIPQALLIPLQVFPMGLDRLNPQAPTVVTCEHGVRSLEAARYLEATGFTRLYNLTYGMADWDGERAFGMAEIQ